MIINSYGTVYLHKLQVKQVQIKLCGQEKGQNGPINVILCTLNSQKYMYLSSDNLIRKKYKM